MMAILFASLVGCCLNAKQSVTFPFLIHFLYNIFALKWFNSYTTTSGRGIDRERLVSAVEFFASINDREIRTHGRATHEFFLHTQKSDRITFFSLLDGYFFSVCIEFYLNLLISFKKMKWPKNVTSSII